VQRVAAEDVQSLLRFAMVATQGVMENATHGAAFSKTFGELTSIVAKFVA
jgi:hypothetical protein